MPLALWMGLALFLRLPGAPWFRVSAAILLPMTALVLLFLWGGWKRILGFGLVFVGVLTWYVSLVPSNQRDWMADVAQIPTASIQGKSLHVRNVRNCDYLPGNQCLNRFEDREYDLDKLQGMDFVLSSWGPRHIAHTMLSFDFGDGKNLVFSIETRKELHESYSPLKGFFREYELCIVAGDERDLIRVRTNYRKEEVRLYRLNSTPEAARLVLMDYIERINGLAVRPEWYNALTANCTTALIGPIRHRSNRLPWSWKLLASGHLDELLFEKGFLDTKLAFDQVRQQALINPLALAANEDPQFSLKIRQGSRNVSQTR